MRVVRANGLALHWREDGDAQGAPVVFANSLGTDLRVWDALIALLPKNLRLIRFDLRGHGLSACPPGPYLMDDLVDDAAALLDALDVKAAVFVGLSIGGMIGQSLAARRPDLVRALVLSNTAARMGEPQMWNDRMATIRAGGIGAIAEATLDRWFGPAFRGRPEVALWRAMLTRTPVEGYLGCCAAIAAADLTGVTRGLRLPALGLAGSQDAASPPDLVRGTVELIPGAVCNVIEGAGHLPCVEAPDAVARILTPFVKEHAHD